jgi:DNA-binding transcriptional ArsR family regulator
MITARFDTEALTRVRFAISPMLELIRSVTTLQDPAGRALHLPWAEQARRCTGGLDLSVLLALQTSDTYNPDFVNPPPSSPLVEFEDELAVMVATPPEQIRAEVQGAYVDAPLPPVLRPFIEDPCAAIEALAELMHVYWERCLAEHWPRIRALLEHDVLYRARRIADGGTERLFADLDPSVHWDDGVLTLEACESSDTRLDLDERGLLLLPSAFVWPKVSFVTAPPWQPTLIYPARGIGMLWSPERLAPADALARLLGRTRAQLLTALDTPHSTIDLAGTLGLTSGAVSQHLGVLRDAGLVDGRRVQRTVLYLRTAEGDGLVATAGEAPAGGPRGDKGSAADDVLLVSAARAAES